MSYGCVVGANSAADGSGVFYRRGPGLPDPPQPLRPSGLSPGGAARRSVAGGCCSATPGPRALTSPSSPPAAAATPCPAGRSASRGQDGAQDLKRIRLIDAAIEASLNKLGVTRYEHIAGWMRDDVKKVSQALGLKGRINQENWIEQALILAKGGETHYSARRARGEAATAAPTSDEGDRASNDGALCRGPCRAPAWLPRSLPRPWQTRSQRRLPPLPLRRRRWCPSELPLPAARPFASSVPPRMPSTQYRPCLCARWRPRTTICSASAPSRPRSKRT